MKFYTGIGSRETPEEYLKIMIELSYYLNKKGWTLRSGGSWGADEAFQKSVTDYSNIFLPTPYFRKNEGINGVCINDKELIREAMYIASKYNLHENWDNLINSKGGLTSLQLHTRNVFQVLGADLRTPSKFVVCYTRDKSCTLEEINKNTGGTRTALRLACHFNVNIFNIAREDHKLRIENWINEMKKEELDMQILKEGLNLITTPKKNVKKFQY
jgi:hypothetical protein